MIALVQADVPLTIDNAYLDAQTVPAPFFGPDTAPGAPTAKMAPADPSSIIEQKKSAAESINFLVKPLHRSVAGGLLVALAFFISGVLELQLQVETYI